MRIVSPGPRRRTKAFPLAWSSTSPGALGAVKRSRNWPIGKWVSWSLPFWVLKKIPLITQS